MTTTHLAAIRQRLAGSADSQIAAEDTPRLLAAVEKVLELHGEYRIYADCDHDEPHTEAERDDGFVLDVDALGETCERSYQYSICAECCFDEGQTEDCVADHPHGPDRPFCRTVQAITEALGGDQ